MDRAWNLTCSAVKKNRYHMKKQLTHLLPLAALMLAFASCQKEQDNTITFQNNEGSRQTASFSPIIGAPPSSFTQKALIESFVSTREGRTPLNDYMIKTVRNQYPNRIIAVNYHLQDQMTSQATYDMLTFLGTTPSALPATMQNRIPYNGSLFNIALNWNNNLASTLNNTAVAGLAIQSTANSSSQLVNALLHVGFNTSLNGKYRLVACLMEHNVTGIGQGYDQANSSNNDPNSPFYNMGDPIPNYIHNHVVRQLLTSPEGVDIPASDLVAGGHFRYRLQFDVSSQFHVKNCYIVAYVYNAITMQVLNAQSARVNTVQNWD
jgi:hypothetical protein